MTVRIFFEESLQELLWEPDKQPWHAVQFPGKRSVKDLIQSLGVPHTEVGQIRVNDQWVDFSTLLREDDRVEVFPVSPGSARIDLDNPRFLCDVHLWKLARRLRLLGFDTLFNPQWDDPELADRCQEQGLILLSRDRGLLKRNKVEQGLLIRSTDSEEQVKEVLQRWGIGKKINPFTRCLLCSGMLEQVAVDSDYFKKKLKPQVPAKVLAWCREYNCCPSCEKVFWQGSHYHKLTRKINQYLDLAAE
jgi:uncharacterized protein with PIN domain/sulfur carrier protein ThiS